MLRIILALLVSASVAPAAASQAPAEGPVWYWFSRCGGPLMTLEVRVDDRVVHKVTIPLCRASRETTHNQGLAGRLEFTWRPTRALAWSIDRKSLDGIHPDEVLEAHIWEAGAESDGLILGVSFASRDQVLVNTVHIAHPARRDESEIVKGLVIRTYPTPR